MSTIKDVEYVVVSFDGTHHEVTPEFFTFPGGEWQMENPDDIVPADYDRAYAVLRTADPIHMIQVGLWGRYFSAVDAPTTLYVPYHPAARSDKGDTAAAGVYADMLQIGNYTTVRTMDIHSLQASALGHNRIKVTPVDNFGIAVTALSGVEYDGVIAPDAGAVERASVVARILGVPVYTAKKERDQATGNIISYQVPDIPSGANHYLVVDDICDGGATFIRLAEGTPVSAKLDLMVTHGIFSRGTDELLSLYESIFTTDSVATPKPGVDIINAVQLMRTY